MLNCPFCDADLGAGSARLRGGRCPQCGSILEWADDPAAQEPEAVAAEPAATAGSANAPSARGKPTISDSDTGFSMKDIIRTLAERNHPEDAGNRATVVLGTGGLAELPPSAAPALGSPAAPLPAGGRRIDLAGERPDRSSEHPDVDVGANVDRVWKGSLTIASQPSMTLKASSAEPDPAITDLLIRPFKIQPPGEPPPDGTEYELNEVIGEGGVGVVYAARQASIDRTVALKMLKSEFAHKRDHRNKFLSEAVVTGELDHPNIVPIYDLGASELGSLFYAMKRVRGTPWNEVIRQQSLAENLRILMGVADAIAFAHSRGVIHRDLKPENVMLGDFGEVLVMDWGIALSTNMFIKSDRISQSMSMGGTPAYMAPEMATGPLERIGPASDVYLLGALLFEIITGLTPHTGKDVMSCLYAAARNELQPTDKSGELLDIAYRALDTKPENRFASVQDFQAAIREYQSHSESIVLSSRADEELAQARHSGDYQDYARALFAFQEAYALWHGNDRAKAGEIEARLAYAAAALDKGDYDLGLSLLDERHPEQAKLRRKLLAAQKERDARKARIEGLRKIAVALVALIVVLLGSGLLFFRKQNNDLKLQTKRANEATKTAKNEKEEADKQRDEAKTQRSNAEQARDAAQVAKELANREAKAALEAQFQQAATSYLAQIGVSAERIANNSFLDAENLLETYQTEWPFFRHWEWAHLQHLCHLEAAELNAGSRVESLARAGDLVAVGTAGGEISVWRVRPADKAFEQVDRLRPGRPITALAISQDGGRIAAASDAAQAPVLVYDRVPGGDQYDPPRELPSSNILLSLALSPDGGRLAAGTATGAVLLWNAASGESADTLPGHFLPVWSAVFLDNQRLVTGSEDATARIWDLRATPPKVGTYRGHREPVYAVAASRDGRWIASAGRERTVHVWPADMRLDVEYEKIQASLPTEVPTAADDELIAEDRAPYHKPESVLVGHAAEVRALAFSDDGSFLLSAGNDNTVRRWAWQERSKSPGQVVTLRGHGGWIRGCTLLPFGDGPQDAGRFAVSGGHDELVKLWDVSSYEEVYPLQGHSDGVLWAAFSKDGSRIVTASRDRQALIWNAETRAPIRALREGPAERLEEGHRYLVSSGAFFPAGDHRVATSAGDRSVRIWDTQSGGQLRRLSGTGTISPLAISADGAWILTGSERNDALLWRAAPDAQEDEPAARLSGHPVEVSAAAFSRQVEATRIATGDIMGSVYVWQLDPATSEWVPKRMETPHERGYGVTAVAFTEDGRFVLSAAHDHTVAMHDAASGRRLPTLLKHDGSVKALDVSADGKRAVTLSSFRAMGTGEGPDRERTVYRVSLWNLATGKEQRAEIPLTRRDESATSVVFDGERDAAIVVSSSGDASMLWRWQLATNVVEPLWKAPPLRGTIWSAAVSPDGDRILAVGGSQGRLLAMKDGTTEKTFSPHSAVTSANFSPSGRYVATSSLDGDVKIWDPASAKVVHKLLRPHRAADGASWHAVNFVAFSPVEADDESTFVTAGNDGRARVWRLAGGPPEQQYAVVHDGPVRSAVFSPDGRYLLTASDDGTARLWDAATGAPAGGDGMMLHHEQRGAEVVAIPVLFGDFSPDGMLVITGCNDNDARIWDVTIAARPVRRHKLQGHTAAVTSVAISRDNLRAATGSQDGMAKIWRLPREVASNATDETGGAKEVLSLKRHGAEVTSVHFSPDGQGVLTSSLDQSAILWPAVPVGPSLRLTSPRFEVAPDGQWHVIDLAAEVLDPDTSDLGEGTLTITADANANAVQLTLDLADDHALRRTGQDGTTIELDGRPVATLSRLAQPAVGLQLHLAGDIQTPEAERLVRALAVRMSPPLDSGPAPSQGAAKQPVTSPPVGIVLELARSDGELLSQAKTSVQRIEAAEPARADLAQQP